MMRPPLDQVLDYERAESGKISRTLGTVVRVARWTSVGVVVLTGALVAADYVLYQPSSFSSWNWYSNDAVVFAAALACGGGVFTLAVHVVILAIAGKRHRGAWWGVTIGLAGIATLVAVLAANMRR